MSASDFSPGHRALPRIFANPKESQPAEITQLLFQSGSKANFPSIKIASEVERDLHIEDLRNAGSFAGTHFAVSKLAKHTSFSPLQIEELVQIARSNSQVLWIIGDSDVHSFYESLLKHQGQL
jgi:hypothetical protein